MMNDTNNSSYSMQSPLTIIRSAFFIALISVFLFSCKKKKEETITEDTPQEAHLIFRFKFDSTQARLNNVGQPSSLPANHASQSPEFFKIGAHYLELAPTANTQLGAGTVLYHAEETNTGGSTAIDFSKSIIVSEGADFISIPLKDVSPGTYEWLRVSLSYQNYDIRYRFQNPFTMNYEFAKGRIASFVGYKSYITSYTVKDNSITVNGNKSQGYWGFESTVYNNTTILSGQSNGTTVPNPISATSPIPAGSCVVTGAFANALTISGTETEDIVVTISLSTNQSFEWYEKIVNGHFDAPGDSVVDMGLRGVIPVVE